MSVDLGGSVLFDLSFHAVSLVNANFYRATFIGMAWFGEATFTEGASFAAATFTDDAWFGETMFKGDAMFHRATFIGCASFHLTTFADAASFSEVTFTRWDWCFMAHVLHLDDPRLNKGDSAARRVWPQQWILTSDPADPTRGRLDRAPDAPEFEAMESWPPPRGPHGAVPLAVWRDRGV